MLIYNTGIGTVYRMRLVKDGLAAGMRGKLAVPCANSQEGCGEPDGWAG